MKKNIKSYLQKLQRLIQNSNSVNGSAVEKDKEAFIITKRGRQVAKIVAITSEEKYDIANVFEEIDNLQQEVGKTGITLQDILTETDN